VAGGKPYSHYAGCALEFECFCTGDSHCNQPGKKAEFKCQKSWAFPEFSVCKGPADWDPELTKRYGQGHWVTRGDQSDGMRSMQQVFKSLATNPLTAPIVRAAGQNLEG